MKAGLIDPVIQWDHVLTYRGPAHSRLSEHVIYSRFRAKWNPVRVKKTRQIKKLEFFAVFREAVKDSSARKIEPLIRKYKIDMLEFEPGAFDSYAAFLER